MTKLWKLHIELIFNQNHEWIKEPATNVQNLGKSEEWTFAKLFKTATKAKSGQLFNKNSFNKKDKNSWCGS